MKDFLVFRRMVTPYIIMVIFWLAVLLLILGIVAATIQILSQENNNTAILGLCILWPIGLPLGILIIRIYCELLILFFRMNETLTDIKSALGSRRIE